MTRRLLVLLVALAALAAACGGGAGDGTAAGGTSTTATTADGSGSPGTAVPEGTDGPPTPVLPVTVESIDGRPVTVDDVSRIVPLEGNLAEVVFALGLGDNVVGRDIAATFEEASDLPVVTRAHDVSAESVLSLRPTLVLADDFTGPPDALEHIRNVGVPVVTFHRALSVAGVPERIRLVAAALGVEERGEALATRVEAEIDAVTDDLPDDADRPLVAFLYMRGSAGVYLIGGPGSGADSMIEAAGGIDAGTASGLSNAFTPITTEALVLAAPDVIVMTTTGLESVGGIDGLVLIPGIAQTPAGRDRRVVTVEDGLLYGFGARTPEALRLLSAEIHQ